MPTDCIRPVPDGRDRRAQPDGVIGRRFALDLGPLKAQKRSVKMFDLDTPCDAAARQAWGLCPWFHR